MKYIQVVWTHTSWRAMFERCYRNSHKKFSDYGGRGIKVCDRWHGEQEGFENFVADMGLRTERSLSIDRIDVNGHYEPSNCRWATTYEQAKNKRSNVYLTVNGKTGTVTDFANEYNINAKTILHRIKKGWKPEEAVVPPPDKTLKLFGEEGTLSDFCGWYNIQRSTVEDRLRRGWDIEKALTMPPHEVKIYAAFGHTGTASELAKIFNIKRAIVKDRLLHGWDIEKALTAPSKKWKQVFTVFGKTGTITELAKIFGIKRPTITDRLRKGWTLEETFTVYKPIYEQENKE